MKLIAFEPMLNQWYMPMTIDGAETRAYLGVFFEENHEDAFSKALEIHDAMTNHYEEQLQEIPMGALDDQSEDFRCMISEGA